MKDYSNKLTVLITEAQYKLLKKEVKKEKGKVYMAEIVRQLINGLK